MPTHSDREEDPFLITAELEIRSILRSVQRSAALLRMYMKGDPERSIMTTLLGFDDAGPRVIVDCAPDADFNAWLVKAPAVIFDTQVDHINIHFTAEGLELTTHDGLPALSFPFPPAIRRVQRREFYRVEIPMGEPLACVVRVAEKGKPARRVDVKVKDVSVGGVALLDTENQLPHDSGITFRDVRLDLPEVGEATVDLEVLRVHTNVLPNRKEIIELACKFVDQSKASSMLIQSYIGRLERRLNAKRRGF